MIQSLTMQYRQTATPTGTAPPSWKRCLQCSIIIENLLRHSYMPSPRGGMFLLLCAYPSLKGA